MLRLGAVPGEMQAMTLDDIFVARLQLLIIMAKAYLNHYPLGPYRLKSIVENADHVENEAIELDRGLFDGSDPAADPSSASMDHAFYQRVQLLARMAKAFARDNPGDAYRREAMQRNLDQICERITFSRPVNDIGFLKVA